MPTKPKQTKTAKASAKKPSKSSVSKKPSKPIKPSSKAAASSKKRPTAKPAATKKAATKKPATKKPASKPAKVTQKTSAKPTKKSAIKPAAKKASAAKPAKKATTSSLKKAPAKATKGKAINKAGNKRTTSGIKATTKKPAAAAKASKTPTSSRGAKPAVKKSATNLVNTKTKSSKTTKETVKPKKSAKAVTSPKPTVISSAKRNSLQVVSESKGKSAPAATTKQSKQANDESVKAASAMPTAVEAPERKGEQQSEPAKSAKPAVKRGKPMNIISTGITAIAAAAEQGVIKLMQDREEEGGEVEFKPVAPAVAQDTMEKLCATYPNAECELTFKNDFELLIAVILSAQTTDNNVNKVTPNLFRRFPTPKALADADENEIKQIIKSTGYFNSKTKNIQACARDIVQRFGGNVPTNRDDLTTLPGVGRKTANVVLGVAHDIPGWTVDTHVQRLAFRLGFTGESDPYKIEMDLNNLFPEKDWSKYSITLIWHGRRCCFARNPNCEGCPVNNQCPSSRV